MTNIMNGSNKVAIELFLDYKVKYLEIETIIENASINLNITLNQV